MSQIEDAGAVDPGFHAASVATDGEANEFVTGGVEAGTEADVAEASEGDSADAETAGE